MFFQILLLPGLITILFFFPFATVVFFPFFVLPFIFVYEAEKSRYWIYAYGLLSCFVFSLVSMGVENQADILNYQNMIVGVGDGSLSLSDFRGEFIFYILLLIVNWIGYNDLGFCYLLLLFLTNLIWFTFLYKTDYKTCLLLFSIMQLFSLIIVNPFLLRQSLSIAILLLGCRYLGWKRFFLFFVSCFIHLSSLLLVIPLYALSKIRNYFFFRIVLVSAASLGFLLLSKTSVNILSDFFKGISSLNFIFIKLSFFYTSVEETPFQTYAFIIGLFSLLALFFWKEYKSLDSDVTFVFFISCILCLMTLNIPIMYNRVGFLFYYCVPLLVYLLMSSRVFGLKFSYQNIVMFIPMLSVVYYTLVRFIEISSGESWLVVFDGNVLSLSFFELVRVLV